MLNNNQFQQRLITALGCTAVNKSAAIPPNGQIKNRGRGISYSIETLQAFQLGSSYDSERTTGFGIGLCHSPVRTANFSVSPTMVVSTCQEQMEMQELITGYDDTKFPYTMS
jgi:hypothetical protein